jgi:AraC family transcriptional regulator, regulatory protein of adaptative response / DNA-3-methyladenine glycosylase II
MTMPPREVCDLARRAKDARFDGLFFTGVRSTRIFCRPVCPAPTPKPQHIVYFPSAAAASDAGYRPCLRCRPELSPGIHVQDEIVRRALVLIGEGWLEDRSVEALAAKVCVGARHLRRLFSEKLGSSPLEVHQAHRILLAKQLLTETALPITEVALASGFASVRRFNDGFKARYGAAPSTVRRRVAPIDPGTLRLRLGYRPPLDFGYLLERMRMDAIAGIERVTDSAFERNASTKDRTQWIRVSASRRREYELILETFGVLPNDIQSLVRRVRRVFDLDADLHAAHAILKRDASLALSIVKHPGRRIACAWNPLEAVTRAIVTHSRDRATAADCLTALSIERTDSPPGLDRRFPNAEELAQCRRVVQRIAGVEAAQQVVAHAAAVLDGRMDYSTAQSLDEFVMRLQETTELPESVAHELAARVLGHPDAGSGATSAAHLRPWRAYAALHRGTPTQEA